MSSRTRSTTRLRSTEPATVIPRPLVKSKRPSSRKRRRACNTAFVHTENSRQVLGERKAITWERLTLSDRPSDLGSHLIVESNPTLPVNADLQHRASYSSPITVDVQALRHTKSTVSEVPISYAPARRPGLPQDPNARRGNLFPVSIDDSQSPPDFGQCRWGVADAVPYAKWTSHPTRFEKSLSTALDQCRRRR